jgi:hypothetical protein
MNQKIPLKEKNNLKNRGKFSNIGSPDENK